MNLEDSEKAKGSLFLSELWRFSFKAFPDQKKAYVGMEGIEEQKKDYLLRRRCL